MSNNIGIARIDTIALTEQLNKMKEERNKLKSLFDIVNKNTNYLKEYWDSRTSESVFNNFEEMYKGYQGLLNDLNRDNIDYTHHHLMTLMQLKLDSILDARLKLEGIGLLKTYLNHCYI